MTDKQLKLLLYGLVCELGAAIFTAENRLELHGLDRQDDEECYFPDLKSIYDLHAEWLSRLELLGDADK
jgi:hypothetical protein